MNNYAVMENDKVINIIIADSKEIAEGVSGHNCIEYTNESPVSIGFLWDGNNFILPEFKEPTEDPVE
jgi:hypothetical protein